MRRGAAGGAQLYAVVQLIGPKHRPHAQALPTSNAPFTDATRAVRNGEAAEIAALPERRIESWPAQSTRVFGPSVGVPLSKFVWDSAQLTWLGRFLVYCTWIIHDPDRLDYNCRFGFVSQAGSCVVLWLHWPYSRPRIDWLPY